MRLSAIRLFVRDLDAARAFYGPRLGLVLAGDGAAQGWLRYDLGGIDLLVEAVADDAPDDEQALRGRFTGVSFAVDDIQAAHQRLAAAGVVFEAAPEQQAWGGWLATFRDPDGNALQLAQYGGVPTPPPMP
jgi:catechol 2,3-dioxygenase-like lactoylglutathione lyase family enzyme